MPNLSRVLLATERVDLEPLAQSFLTRQFPDVEIRTLSLQDFLDSLELDREPDLLRVLVIQCGEDGQIDPGSSLARSILNSFVPVLVLRSHQIEHVAIESIQRVVVPLDGSTYAAQALPLASRIARDLNVPVRFLMVIDPSRVIPPAYAYDPDAWGLIEELRQTSHWALTQAEISLRQDGVEVGSDLLYGPINASLSANIGPHDLVVMTTHGTARQREGVTLRTLISVPQPMIVMRAMQQEPIVVDGYEACSWVEPLHRPGVHTA